MDKRESILEYLSYKIINIYVTLIDDKMKHDTIINILEGQRFSFSFSLFSSFNILFRFDGTMYLSQLLEV